ncbi:MAG: acyltransferase [Oceanobacter sp.]
MIFLVLVYLAIWDLKKEIDMSFNFLWVHREKPAVFSKRWFVVWLKRAFYTKRLIVIFVKNYIIVRKGGEISNMVLFGDVELNGDCSNLKVGSESFLGTGTHLALHDRIVIGKNVVLNNNVCVFTASHSLSDQKWRMYSKPVYIGDYAWVASGATILPGVRIGKGAVVGAGSVVRSDVPDYGIAIGNPAEVLKGRRVEGLNYSPVALSAPFEAWIGRNKYEDF